MSKDYFLSCCFNMLFFSYVWAQRLFSWWGYCHVSAIAVNLEFQLLVTASNFISLIKLNHIKSTFIT